jgi:hypothetical protein
LKYSPTFKNLNLLKQNKTTLKNTTTTIARNSSYFNPYFFEGKQISRLVFFKDGNELARVNWFTLNVSNNRVPLIDFETPILNKRKIDLNTKQVYYFSGNIYIHADIVEFKFVESETIDMENEYRIRHKFQINVLCQIEEGYINEQEQYRTRLTDLQKRNLIGSYAVDFEPKPQQIQANKLADEFKSVLNVDISKYDIYKLLNKYQIINKI